MVFLSDKHFSAKYGITVSEILEDKADATLSQEEQEFIDWCKSFANGKLYLSWIQQNQGILSFLNDDKPYTAFKDTGKVQQHSLYGEFKSFIAPFLMPCIQAAVATNSFAACTYVQLLPQSDRELIEAQAYRSFQKKNAIDFEKAQLALDEGPVLHTAQVWLSEEMLAFINALSRESYVFKVDFVDQALKLLSFDGCTLRLANWIVKQLEVLELNPEHRQEVSGIRDKLRNGEIQIKNKQTHKKVRFSRRQIMTLVVLLFLLASGALLFIYKPFSTPDDPPIADSSFEQFTKAERLQIDSLLKEIQPDIEQDPATFDPYIGMQELNLLLRDEYKNASVEQFYTNVVLAVESKEFTQVDSCKTWSKTDKLGFTAQGFRSLKSRSVGSSILLRNESDYDVLLVIFDNTTKGDAFSMVVPKGQELSFKMDLYEKMWLICGNDWGEYRCSTAPCPTDDFTSFFCTLDGNAIFSFTEVYTLSDLSAKGNKILLTGDLSTSFQFVDIYHIFDSTK